MLYHSLLIILTTLTIGRCLSAAMCDLIIDQTNPTQYCNNMSKKCDFSKGIQILTNNTGNKQFQLCIYLSEFNISIGPNIKDQLSNSVYIESSYLSLLQNYTMLNDDKIVFKAANQVQTFKRTYLSGSLIWMQAPSIYVIQSTFKNVSSINSQCSCYDQATSNCTSEWDFNFPSLWTQINSTAEYFNITIFTQTINYTAIQYNTIILYGQNLVQVQNSSLVSSIIGVFAENVTITNQSVISTTGNGFPSATGYGCGYFDQILNQLLGCTGSGGSYGGFGGNSWPDNCNLMISRTPYSQDYYPSAPGSGGGFFLPNVKEASSGGGVINIQGNTIDIWNSSVQADGKSGTQGGGGGAGGSIALDYTIMSGNSVISVDGGTGKSSGGGGRLWLWNHNWRFQKYSAYLSQFNITAQGGTGCLQLLSCGQNGSITTSPCQPGFQLNPYNFICEYCPLGSYQSQYGYTQCEQCLNKPANSQYIQTNSSNLFKNACNYTCDDGYGLVGQICLSNFITIINIVGGVNMLISVGIIICVLIGYLIVVLFQKLTQKELFNKGRQQDQFEKRMLFRVEDIPFHQKRVYFSGQNNSKKPWFISDKTRQQYRRHVLPPINKLDNIFNKLCKQINNLAKYSKTHSVLMTILKFYYFPLSRYIEQLYRVQKSETIEKLIIQTNKKIPQSENLGIKFHVQPYCTIGCLQIFNYTKSALDFYIQNYFPMYFQLQKMPLGGYSIDLNDPFMRAFITQIDQKDNKSFQSNYCSNKIYQKYIIELDELLRNSQQLVPILNHLWMMTEYNPSIQVYLYQHENRVLGVEPWYSISDKHPLYLVFSSENISTRHFISQQTLKNIYHHKVEYFNNQYKFRQQVMHQDKKSVLWQIENNFNEKVLSWSLGILTIFILLQVVIAFFILIFVQAEKQVSFTYGIIVYFAIFPFSEFFSVFLCFRLILSKNCKILADSLYFTLGNIFKLVLLIIIGMIANIGIQFSNILMSIIFYIWILSFLCNIVSMLLKLLLHWHYSRHRGQNGQQQLYKEKKKKIN